MRNRGVYRQIDREMKKENLKKDALNNERVPQSEIRKFLLKYFLTEWKMIAITQVVLFTQAYLNIYQPFFTQDFIEAAIKGETEELIQLVKTFVIQNFILIISEPMLQLFISKFKKRLQIKIQSDIFKEILSKDFQFFEMTKFVQIQQLANQGAKGVMDLACGDRIFSQLKNIFRAIGHCFFLFYKSFYISMILLTFCIVKAIWNHISNKWKVALAKDNYKDMLDKDHKFQDVMHNVMTVKAFGREAKEIERYKEQLDKISQQSIHIERQNQKMMIVNEVLDKLQRIIVLYYGAIFFISAQEIPKVSTITTLLQYSHSFISVYNSIKELIGYDDQNMYIMVEAIVTLFKNKPIQGLPEYIHVDVSQPENKEGVEEEKKQESDETSKLLENSEIKNSNESQQELQKLPETKKKTLLGDIEFDKVCYKYGGRQLDEYVLKNVSFSIKGGEFVAFAGTSGSGKSTVIKLIERFYDVNEGCVIVDGQNVKDLSVGLLRTQIGLVQQEPVLFDTTILENIVYGVDVYSMDTVNEVCDISGVSEFVFDKERFPDGLNTLVGSKGLMLSGGQKQRVAIARALIKRPKILIFDEATSSLDAESEFQVQKYIDQLVKKRGMTIVVVAHRLSTIVNCDRIYVMQKGEIIESGSHRELLEANGFYKQLINRQLYNEENTNYFGINESSNSLDNPKKKDDNNIDESECPESPQERVKKSKPKYKKQDKQNADDRDKRENDNEDNGITPNENVNRTPLKSSNVQKSLVQQQQYSEKKQKLNQINEQIQLQMQQKSQLIQQMQDNIVSTPRNQSDNEQKAKDFSLSFSAQGLSDEQISLMMKKLQNLFEEEKQNLLSLKKND